MAQYAEKQAQSSQSAAGATAGDLAPQQDAAQGQSAEFAAPDKTATPNASPAPGDADKAAYDKAREAHRVNVKKLDDTIKTGLTDSTTKHKEVWPNACAWIKAGKTKLVALTRTHDAEARATELGKSGKAAMFGIDTAVPGDSSYNQTDKKDNTNIYVAKPTWLGFRQSGSSSLIAIIEPSSKSNDDLLGVIVHEVQHDADHHKNDDYNRYLTEFRAYWLDKGFEGYKADAGSADPALTTNDGTKLEGFDNARQQHIFKHLWDCGSYDYVKDVWKDEKQRKEMLALGKPTGTNLVDSPRIDDVYLKVSNGAPIEEVLKAAATLNADDKRSIADARMKGEWVALIHKKYKDTERLRIQAAVGLISGVEGAHSPLVDQLFQELNEGKADEDKILALAGKLTEADKKVIALPEYKAEFIRLVNKNVDAEKRPEMLKALGLAA